MRTARAITALALAGGVLSTTACDLTELGGYRTVAAQDPAPPPAATSPAPIPSVVPVADAPKPVVVLQARVTGKFGTLVTDARGRTLYRSDKDSARPPKSRCVGKCVTVWRPALVTGTDLAVVGVDRALVGSIPRGRGTRQLTLAGWPVYTFVKDRPGEVLGQCKGGFFAITPEGAKTTMRG